MVVENDLPILINIQNYQQQFQSIENQLKDRLESYWQAEKTDWVQFENISIAWTQLKQQLSERMSQISVIQQAVSLQASTIWGKSPNM